MVNLSQANSRLKSATDTLKILVVDDQKFVRYKLQEMLSTDENLQVVGTASDGEMAIAQVESLKPDVVLIDIEMPKMDGIEATKIITQRFPDCKILIFSSYEHPEYIQKIITAGADGYVLKSTPTDDLVRAIHSVSKGYSHFDSQLIKKIQLTENDDRAPQNHLKSATSSDSTTADESEISNSLESRSSDRFLPFKWLTWGRISLITMVILAVPAITILRYKTVIRAAAVVRPAEKLHSVRAAVEGEVARILVEEGQEVERGQAIATIDVSRSQIEQSQLNKSIEQQKRQLDRLNAQIGSLSSQVIAETERKQSEMAAAKSELENIRRNGGNRSEASSKVEAFLANVKAVEANLEAARAKYNRYKSVAETGAITRRQLLEAESAVARQEQELEFVRSQLKRAVTALDSNTVEIDAFQQRIQQVEKSSLAAIAGLNRQREGLIQQRTEINEQLERDLEELDRIVREPVTSQLIATATGKIYELNLNDGTQTIRLGQEVARIIPENLKIQMKAAVLPQDVTKLEEGQEVKMQVSACPSSDYGTLRGTVAQITRDDDEIFTQQVSNSQVEEASSIPYEVTIAPDSNTFGREKYQCSLQLGMESQVDIISREETLLHYILRKAGMTAKL